MKKKELLAPVGSFSSLKAAIQAGADSIYFGVKNLNMRSHSSKNFDIEDIKTISNICKKEKKKAYLALNTIIYDTDIKIMKKILDEAKKEKIDAVIASDIACIDYANKIGVDVHLSTQLNVCNIEAVRFFSKYANCAVLARELSLDQIKEIKKQIEEENILGKNNKKFKIEIFIHGALCTAISGRCYMSLFKYNWSANRGKCLQPCRRKYRVIEEETGKEVILENKYVMSPKDICTLSFLKEILEISDILKIEGRARSSEYVYTTVKIYKDAIESIKKDTFTKEKITFFIKELKKVYNRDFSSGYYLKKDLSNMWTNSYGSKATEKKIYIGKAVNYFSHIKVGEFIIEAQKIEENDTILIVGNKTGVLKTKVKSLKIHENNKITFLLSKKIRRNDQLYKIENVEKN